MRHRSIRSFQDLSEASRYLRFFFGAAGLEEAARRSVDVDYHDRCGLVATVGREGKVVALPRDPSPMVVSVVGSPPQAARSAADNAIRTSGGCRRELCTVQCCTTASSAFRWDAESLIGKLTSKSMALTRAGPSALIS